MKKQNLKGMSLSELQSFVETLGEKKFRGAQLYSWMYVKSAQSFYEMTNVSKEFQEVLEKVPRVWLFAN